MKRIVARIAVALTFSSSIAIGFGAPSQAAVPTAPVITSVTPSAGSLSIAFTAAGGTGITNYEYSIDGGLTWVTRSPASTTSPISITGLTNCSTYPISLRAINADGAGAAAESWNGVPSAYQYVLNNGLMRFGTGSEASIQTNGSLKQGWYYNGSSWYKLSFASYPLNYQMGVGGVGTSEWNTNGTLQEFTSTVLARQTIDCSGFVQTSLSGSLATGYGTLSTTGRVTIGSQTIEITRSYTQSATSRYTTFRETVRNVSATTLSNARVWVGTQDDWVGSTDGPRKRRGNISNGTFSVLTNSATQAKALEITAGTDMVYFYSTSNLAQISINSCCSFSNSTNQNPATSSYDQTNDGSYAIYVRFQDIAPSASESFTWYYLASNSTNAAATLSNVATAALPAAPTIDSVAAGNAGATINFTAGDAGGSAITNYQYSVDGGTTWVTRSPASTSSPLTVSGLTNGSTYNVQIRAVNSEGSGTATSSTSVTPLGPPTAPLVSSISQTDTSISVAYTAPSSNGGDTITNYEYSIDGGTTWITRSPVSVTSPLTISGLTAGTTYSFALRAVNSQGSGTSSSAQSVTTYSSPGAPTISSVTASNGTLSADISYGSNGGTSISNIEYSTDGGTTWVTRSPASTYSPLLISGLTNGQTYALKVRAVNSVGSGTPSSSFTATPSTVPSSPTLSGTVIASNQQIQVTISPNSDGGSAITSYEYSTDRGATWQSRTDSGGTSTSLTVTTLSTDGSTTLTNGTEYCLQVRAVNANGRGPASSDICATPKTFPDAPAFTTTTSRDRSLEIVYALGGNGGSAITDVEYCLTTCSTNSNWISTGATSSPFTITGLINGTNYTVLLRAVNSVGVSTTSTSSNNTGTPANVPSPPNVSSVVKGAGEVTVTFTAPDSDGGLAITNYQYSIDGGTNWITRSPSGTASPLTISGLTNGNTYGVTLRAVTSSTTGLASTVSYVTPSTTPEAPTGVTFTALSGRIGVSFTAATDGGSPITTYEYSISTDNGSSYGSWVSANTTNASFTINGLTNGTGYRIKLRAVNGNGNGTATATPASNTTPAGVPESPVITSSANAVSAPASLTGNQISVSFTEPSNNGSAITNYQYSTDGGSTWINRTDGTGRFSPIVISNLSTNGSTALTYGTTYPVQIRAVNANGSGAASSSTSVTAGGVVDNTPPTVTLTAPSTPTSSRSLTFTAAFSESVSGISTADLVQTGSATCTTTSVSSSSGSSVTFSVTCTTDGTVVMKMPANSVIDSASNNGPTGNTFASSVTIDSIAPTATVTSPTSISSTRTLTYSVSFSESVAGVSAADFVQASGSASCTTSAASATSGTSISFTVVCSTDGTVIMQIASGSVSDGVNSGPPTATAATAVEVDSVSPTVEITSPVSPVASHALTYFVTFSENVSGIDASDFVQTGGTASCSTALVTAQTSTSYSFNVGCTTDGTVVMSLNSNAGTDAAGNASPAAIAQSSTTTINALPDKIQTISGSLSGSTLVVTWVVPANSNKQSPISHTATLTASGQLLSCQGTSTTCTITGLVAGTTYALNVASRNSFGLGPASESVTVIVPSVSERTVGANIPSRFEPIASGLGYSSLAKSVQTQLVEAGVVTPPKGTQTLVVNFDLTTLPTEVSALLNDSKTIAPGVAIEQRFVAPATTPDGSEWYGYLRNLDGKWISLGTKPAQANQEVVLPAMSLVEPGTYKVVSTIISNSSNSLRGFGRLATGVFVPRTAVTPTYGKYTIELTVVVKGSSKKTPVISSNSSNSAATPSPSASSSASATPSPTPEPTTSSQPVPIPVVSSEANPWVASNPDAPIDDRGLVVINPAQDAPQAVAETAVTAVTLVTAVTAAAAATTAVAAAAGAAASAAASAAAGASAGAASTSAASGSSGGGSATRSTGTNSPGNSSSSGTSSNSSSSDSGNSNQGSSEENSDLTEIEYENDGITIEHIEWGDGLSWWQKPWMTLLDQSSHAATVSIAPFSPLLSKLINDGAYLRSMFGTLSVVLSFVSALIGTIGIALNGSVLLPPPLAILIALAVIGVMDAFAGVIGVTLYLAGVSLLAGIHTLGDIRLLVGTAAVAFAPGLLASAFRGLRREKATGIHAWWERAVDFAVAPFLGGWATSSMVGALPALAGVALPIADHANTVGFAVAIALIFRVAGEEVAAQLFPERLNKIHPDEVPDTSMRQKSIALTLRMLAFLFVAGALVGNTWQLYAGGLLFIIPSILSLYQDKLPNYPWLYQLLPGGLPGLAFALVFASATLNIMMAIMGATPALAKMAFVLVPIPGFIMSLLGIIGREPANGDVRWYQRPNMVWVYRIGGIVVLLYTLRLTGIL